MDGRDFFHSSNSDLGEKFTERFPGMSLLDFLSEFSYPTPYSERKDFLSLPQQQVTHQRYHREMIDLNITNLPFRKYSTNGIFWIILKMKFLEYIVDR